MSQTDWVFGIHAIAAILEKNPQRILELFVQKGRTDKPVNELLAQAEQQGLAVQRVERQKLDHWLGQTDGRANHQGLAARVKPLKARPEAELLPMLAAQANPLLLVLDNVTDPHNLGACLRTADAAGVSAVIVPKDKSAGLTATCIKVASGAAESLAFFQVTNLARTLEELKQAGVWLVGTAGEAEQRLYEADLKGPLALIMGAEGKGLRRLTRETCDYLVKIPMAGAVSSLNVSVASGVCLFEAVRQRQQ